MFCWMATEERNKQLPPRRPTTFDESVSSWVHILASHTEPLLVSQKAPVVPNIFEITPADLKKNTGKKSSHKKRNNPSKKISEIQRLVQVDSGFAELVAPEEKFDLLGRLDKYTPNCDLPTVTLAQLVLGGKSLGPSDFMRILKMVNNRIHMFHEDGLSLNNIEVSDIYLVKNKGFYDPFFLLDKVTRLTDENADNDSKLLGQFFAVMAATQRVPKEVRRLGRMMVKGTPTFYGTQTYMPTDMVNDNLEAIELGEFKL